MTDDEIAQFVAAGDAVSSPEAIASYFNSPAGKQGLANQQLGVNKWSAANSMAHGGTNTSAFTTGSPEMAFAFPWIAALGFGGLDAALGASAAAGAGGGAAGGAEGLADITVPSAGSYLAPVGAGGGAGAGAAVGPPSSLAGSVASMAPPEGASSGGGWQQQVKRLFHMGGNGGQQRQPYHYQNPAVADYAQQQQAAEMLAEALNKKQPIDPIVRGGPVPVGRY